MRNSIKIIIGVFLCLMAVSSVLAQNWGFPGCLIQGGDYNGDGFDDGALYHQPSGNWYIRQFKDNNAAPITFGLNWGYPGAYPVEGDYDGNGTNDLAVYDPVQGQWFIRTLDGQVLAWYLDWGYPGAGAVPGDYNGDGKDDLAVYDPVQGQWFIRDLATPTVMAWFLDWGFYGAQPVPGDYNGDGTNDLAIFHEASGNWYIRTLAGEVLVWGLNWGFPGCTPVPGDINNDGKADLTIYERSTGAWFSRNVDDRPAILMYEYWGENGYLPFTGNYLGTDTNKIGVYDPVNGNWYLAHDWNSWSNEFKTMTFNVAVTIPTRNTDYPAYVEALADMIIDNKVDVLALQEVAENREGVNLLDILVNALMRKNYPMWGRYGDRNGVQITLPSIVGGTPIDIGNAILSRFPIAQYQEFPFYAHGPDYGGPGQHLVQSAQLVLPSDDIIRVFNHHPHPALGQGPYFWDDFLPLVNAYAGEHTFLLGDYYFERTDAPYVELSKTYTEVYTEYSDSSLLITTAPAIQVNYYGFGAPDLIFYNSGTWSVKEAHADQTVTISDHYPVISIFEKP